MADEPGSGPSSDDGMQDWEADLLEAERLLREIERSSQERWKRLRESEKEIQRQEHVEKVRRESWRVRPKVYSRDGGYCRYCGVKLDEAGEWHVDHIEPVYRGGGSEMENLALACVDCNLRKGTRSPADFLDEMERGSLAAFLDEPRQRGARDDRNAMIAFGCALAAGIVMFVAVALPTSRVGGFFAALAAFVLTAIVVAVVVRGPRCETCSAPPVEGASLCGTHLAAQRRSVSGRKRRPRRRNYWAR